MEEIYYELFAFLVAGLQVAILLPVLSLPCRHHARLWAGRIEFKFDIVLVLATTEVP